MFETIVRLTDEDEAVLREVNAGARSYYAAPRCEKLGRDLFDQARAALALYDRLVAEAKAASDA